MAEHPNEYHLLAFDPGGTIGWAWFVLNFKAFSRPEAKVLRWVESWDCGEFTGTENQQIQKAVALIYRARFGTGLYTSRTDVVSEDFDLTQLVGGKDLLSPVRINAVLDWECRRVMALELNLQARQMRTNVTKERLKLFGFEDSEPRTGKVKGWTTTGKGKDKFAAMQHAVTWMRRIKQKSIDNPWKLSDSMSTNATWDCRCERLHAPDQVIKCDLSHP